MASKTETSDPIQQDAKILDEGVSSTTLEETSQDVEKVEQPAAEDTSQYLSGLKLVTLIIALCLAVFIVALDQTIIATAIPKITDQFHSISDIGWYGSAYFLTATSLQPTFGRVYKVFNVGLTSHIFHKLPYPGPGFLNYTNMGGFLRLKQSS
jgi:hypothetical protein